MGTSITAPLFTGGRLKAGIEEAQAVYRQSLAQYEKTVLGAYQETEDQLSALHFLAQEAESQNRAVLEAKRAQSIATSRYREGLVSYLDVITTEQTVLATNGSLGRFSQDIGWRVERNEDSMIRSMHHVAIHLSSIPSRSSHTFQDFRSHSRCHTGTGLVNLRLRRP